MKKWNSTGGVLLLGYDLCRNMSNENAKMKCEDDFEKYLVNSGPDLLVCDEGHLLKNAKLQRSQAINRIRTKRRILLFDTSLQNNLEEFWYFTSHQ